MFRAASFNFFKKVDKMKQVQRGFTLIELVMVIVILGILAAVALPKFVDLTGDARKAAAQGVAGALASAGVINYSASLVKGQVQGKSIASATAIGGVIVDTTTAGATPFGCNNTVAGNLTQAGVTYGSTPGTYAVTLSSGTATNIGDTVVCLVTSNDDTSKTGTFVLLNTK
jgi:MSHA pilin protein MshA